MLIFPIFRAGRKNWGFATFGASHSSPWPKLRDLAHPIYHARRNAGLEPPLRKISIEHDAIVLPSL